MNNLDRPMVLQDCAFRSIHPINRNTMNLLKLIARNSLLFTLTAGGYFLLGKLGLTVVTVTSQISPVWPASGFAAGMLILFGRKLWPAVFIASFAINFQIEPQALPSLLMASGNALEAVAAAFLFVAAKNWFDQLRLRRIAGAIAVVATFAPAVSATFAAMAVSVTSTLTWNKLFLAWGTWWCGNFLGILFVLPVVLVLFDHNQEWRILAKRFFSLPGSIATLLGIYLSTLLLDFVFLDSRGAGFIFAIFPLLLLAIRWSGIIGLRLITILIFSYATIATHKDLGPFALGSTSADYFQMQIFMTVFAVTSLSLGELYRSVRFRHLFLVLLPGWFLSGVIFYSFYDGLIERDEKHFRQVSEELTGQFQQKFNLYENVLRAGAARLSGKTDILPESWKNFVETLDLEKNFPGINGLAILYEVPGHRKLAFEKQERSAYKGHFSTHVLSENKEEDLAHADNQYILTHVEPKNENFQAHGLNITLDPIRVRTAMDAKKLGSTAVSQAIQLVQDQTRRKGYAIMYPVKNFKASANMTAAWIVAPYAIDRVVQAMTTPNSKEINYWLVDETPTVDEVMYSTNTSLPLESVLKDSATLRLLLPIGQKNLTLLIQRNPVFFDPEDYFLAWMGALAALLSLMVAWMYCDIYSFKERAEELALKKTKELSRREDLWLTVMKAAPVGFFHLNNDGELIYRNQKADDITGLHANEFVHLQRTIGAQGPHEFPILQPNKESVWVKGITAPVHNENGESTGTVGILVDITEKRNQEALLEHQRLRSMQASKMATLGEMAGGIAHEINNPLAIISARAQMLQQQSEKIHPSAIRDYADKIEQTVQRIASIVRGLRTFSRNGENDPTTLAEASQVITDTLEFCRGNLARNNVTLHVALQENLILHCRPTQISQVILNLINNAQDAIQALPEKWIRLESSLKDGMISIRVTDSGTGIPYEIAEKMMQPFFTTKEVGKGTGLGLSISRGIVEDHRGKLYLDPSSAHTSFVIELPAAFEIADKAS